MTLPCVCVCEGEGLTGSELLLLLLVTLTFSAILSPLECTPWRVWGCEGVRV